MNYVNDNDDDDYADADNVDVDDGKNDAKDGDEGNRCGHRKTKNGGWADGGLGDGLWTSGHA